MRELSSTDVASLLAPYHAAQSERLIELIRAYIPLLLDWNRKISLTTVTDPVEIVKFHFGESLFAASALPVENCRLADVGSGAGFPGMPLVMAIPGLQATLIESNAKKVAFLLEVARRLELSNVSVVRSRMEDVATKEPFDSICARAVGKHASIMRWARRNLNPKGRLVLFLGEEDTENVRKTSQWNWESPLKIPGSAHRFILSGTPVPFP
jgi:16S rRNA (guanine527-N7)-methyltransferase